ncbi:MAG: hypothetical protein OEM62_01800 [Acidobacteriota bacterium]|nr:hypothetical protein [Acidobacteriota bacterium]
MRSQTRKTLIVIGAVATTMVVGWVLLIGAVLAWGGLATVSIVDRHGADLTLPIPMAAVDIAVASGDLIFDVGAHLNSELKLGEWEPLARQILMSLDECPDAVFVEVSDGGDHVRVAKQGRSLLIEVSDTTVDVRVSVPMRSVRRAVGRLLS